MNQFFTEVEIPDPGWKVNHQHKIMLMGSCFAENIGSKLVQLKFNVDQNPFGILYNPKSIEKSLRRLIEPVPYKHDDLFVHEGVWASFDHHSRFSSTDADELLVNINKRLGDSCQYLKEVDYLFITFGTAWAFESNKNQQVVSNCHKLPSKNFTRFRLSTAEIVSMYEHLLNDLLKFNPNLKILFTVSPIRHWKDGAIGNQLSKSTLLLAIDNLINNNKKRECSYFPAYEIVMDQLRDYRFYASDLVHLNDSAVEFIWSKFSNLMFSDETEIIIKDVIKLAKSIGHRPFNSRSESYRKFLLYNLNEIERLTKKFPFLNFRNEKIHFENELNVYQSDEQKTLK